jgi:rare lipoprotein A
MSFRNALRLFATACFVVLVTPAAIADEASVQQSNLPATRAVAFAYTLLRAVGDVQTGLASFYHHSLHGLKTASGERYDQHAMTAAHPFLPIGTAVKVTNRHNRRSVVVRINDRGPNFGSRILDLSWAAAAELGMLRRGVAPIKLEVLALAY